MRNLKRTLSLALAAVMLMGMMVVGAGAASKDFTDGDEITNVEAVDVMVALGILEGGDNGAFQPNTILTREQAAKIICYMLLGSENAEKLATSGAVFNDVAADRWSAPFISYCVNLGILAGDGQGNFFPEGKLTGAAFGKMLLVALGYDASVENYVGDSWMINVASDALDAGILPDGMVLTDELSRQDAAQMAFQTLTATMVKYENAGTSIDLGNGGSININPSKAEPVKATKAGGYLTADNDEYVQFCEKYFSKLTLNAKGNDAFGRPADIWTYDKEEVGTYALAADASYTAEVKSGTLYTDLGLSKTTVASVVVDGEDDGNFTVKKSGSDKTGGKGVLTEAFVDEDKNVTLVQINTYVGKVTNVVTADDVKNDEKPYIEISGLSNVVYDGKFETAVEYAEDDIVLYTYDKSEKEIKSVALAEKVEDLELTSKTGTTKFVAGGTTYEYGATAAVYGGNLKDSVNVYLDTNGYVVYVEKYEAGSTNYAFVLDTKTNNDGWTNGGKITYEAKLLLTDGSVIAVDTDTKQATVNTFVSYTVDDDDVYTLTAKDVTSGKGTHIDITKGVSSFDINGTAVAGGVRYANSSTIFLVYDNTNEEYAVYTGIANVPTMSGAATVYVNSKTSSSVASIVYISAADTVVSDANKALVYIIAGSESSLINDADKGNYYTYDAVIDGEITTVDVAATEKLTADVLASKLTYNSKGVVTNITEYTENGDDKMIKGIGTLKTTDGTVGLNGVYYTYAEDVVVYKIEDNDFSKVSVTSIRDDSNDTFKAVVKDGEVIAIFITVKEGSTLNEGEAVAGTQDELNAALKDSSIKSIQLGDGTFKLDTAVNREVTIEGSSNTVIENTVVDSDNQSAGIYVKGTADVTISGVTFKGGNGQFGIVTATTYTGNLTVENCVFEGMNVGVYVNKAANVVINNCTFSGCTAHGIGADTFATLKGTGNTYTSCAQQVVVYEKDEDNVSVNGNLEFFGA